MGDLNINRQMLQALQGQEVQRLANEILADGKVDSADNEKIRALRAELKAAAEADGNIDSSEDSLMDALDSTGLFGTNKEVVKNNLTQLTKVATMDANNFNFNIQTQDGVGGFFGGRQDRTVRLSEASQNSQTVDPELENALNEAQPSGSTTTSPAEATAPPAGSTTAPPAEATALPANPIPTEPIEVPQNTTMQDRLAYEQQNLSNALQPLEQELQQNTPAARQQIANMLNLDPEDPELAQKVDAKRDELLNAMQAYRQNPAENFNALSREVGKLVNAYANNPQVDSSPITMTDLANLRGALFSVSDADYLAETEQNRVNDGRHTVRSDNTDALNQQLNNVSTAAREDLGNAVQQSSQYVQQLKTLQSTNPALFQEMYPGVSADDIAALESQVDSLRQAVESGEPIGQEQTSQLNRLWGTMDQLEKRQQTPASVQALQERVAQQNPERQAELQSGIADLEEQIAGLEEFLNIASPEEAEMLRPELEQKRAALAEQQNELSALESGPALSAEEQSLLDAYQDAADGQKSAFRAVRDSFWAVEDSGTERAGILADLRQAESNIATSLAEPDITPEARQQLEQQQRAVQQARTLIENGETVAFDNPEDQAAFETVLSNLNQARQDAQSASVSSPGTSWGTCGLGYDPLFGVNYGLGLNPSLGLGLYDPLFGSNYGLGLSSGYGSNLGFGLGSPYGSGFGLGSPYGSNLGLTLGSTTGYDSAFGNNTSLGFSSPFNLDSPAGAGSFPTTGRIPTSFDNELLIQPNLPMVDLDSFITTTPIELPDIPSATDLIDPTAVPSAGHLTGPDQSSSPRPLDERTRRLLEEAVPIMGSRNLLLLETVSKPGFDDDDITHLQSMLDAASAAARNNRQDAEYSRNLMTLALVHYNNRENDDSVGLSDLSSNFVSEISSPPNTRRMSATEASELVSKIPQTLDNRMFFRMASDPELYNTGLSQIDERIRILSAVPPGDPQRGAAQAEILVLQDRRQNIVDGVQEAQDGINRVTASRDDLQAILDDPNNQLSSTGRAAIEAEIFRLNNAINTLRVDGVTPAFSEAVGRAETFRNTAFNLNALMLSNEPQQPPLSQILSTFSTLTAPPHGYSTEDLQTFQHNVQLLINGDAGPEVLSALGISGQPDGVTLNPVSDGVLPDNVSNLFALRAPEVEPGTIPEEQTEIGSLGGRLDVRAKDDFSYSATSEALGDPESIFAKHANGQPVDPEAFLAIANDPTQPLHGALTTLNTSFLNDLREDYGIPQPPSFEERVAVASEPYMRTDVRGSASPSGDFSYENAFHEITQHIASLSPEEREAEIGGLMNAAGYMAAAQDVRTNDADTVSFTPQAGVSPRTQALINEANALGDSLILAPVPSAGGEDFLNNLINDFIDIIRDLDYKTRQLVLQQLAQQMTNNAITQFYKDKVDEGNDYHQQALDRLSENFREQIERTIESSLASQADSSQGVAAVSGQVTGAALANAIENVSARENIAQMLDITAQMNPPLSQQQQERILDAVTRIMEAGGVPHLTDAQLGLPGLSNPLLRDQVVF